MDLGKSLSICTFAIRVSFGLLWYVTHINSGIESTCYFENIFSFSYKFLTKNIARLNMTITMRNIIIIVAAALMLSCKNGNSVQQTPDFLSATFRQFSKKFKLIELPFVYRNVQFVENIDIENLQPLDIESNDTLFIKTDYWDGIKCYGMLSDTSKFFSLILFFPADSYYPVLATYDKGGKLIDQTKLIVTGYGADCGLEYYSSTGIVNKDLTIFCTDTVKWEYFCDPTGEPVPNSGVNWINTKYGSLTSDGTLKMTDDKHEETKAIR
jgi:hypothetical protein